MKAVSFFDSHAHLTGDALIEKVDALIQRAQAIGVNRIVNICTNQVSLERGLELAARQPAILNAAATTPHDVEAEGDEVFHLMTASARESRLVAVGETGLDYYYEHSDRTIQKDFLRRYLHLALECRLPVIIHCREAFADFFDILDAEYTVNGRTGPGVLHCFTGTLSEAEGVLKRGFYLSLSGIVTYKKSEALRQVAKMVPLDRLLVETDAPFLAPQSHRGQVNEPAFLSETCSVIAAVRGVSVAEVASATYINASRVFGLQI